MRRALCIVTAVAAILATSHSVGVRASRPPDVAAAMSVYYAGLDNPRGLKFGPDGALYVAEGGVGGSAMTSMADCAQVAMPIGPYSGGFTSRISRIASGARTTVADGLPSSQTGPALGSLVSGVADVAFVGTQMYAIEAGAGCSHGLLGTDNQVLRVNSDGTTTPVANLSAYQRTHPVAQPEADDFEPDGTWYSMIEVRGSLYAVEPNHGEVVRIDPNDGTVTRLVDVSATEGHIVPTTIAYKGTLLFGNLGLFPVVPGSSAVHRLTPSGQIKTWSGGLTTVLGLVVGRADRLFALESMTAPGFPGPSQLGTGQVVQIDPNGNQTTIASGLSFPTAMTLGPDSALYVSNMGFGGPVPGLGQIVRITIPSE